MVLIPITGGGSGEPGPKGDKGDKGDPGSPGTAATVTVGTVTTGAEGSSAAVTNSGTAGAAVLNFTIPRGASGSGGTYSGPGTSAAQNLASTRPGGTGSLFYPVEDLNYYLTYTDATVGSQNAYVISFPKPATPSTRHWVRITTTIKDRARDGSPLRVHPRYVAASNSSLGAWGDRIPMVLPGREVGCVSTIDYEWNPRTQTWGVTAWSGDVLIRRARQQYTPGVEYGLPWYVSEELAAAGTTYLDPLSRALAGVPIATRRLLGNAGVFIDSGFQTMNEQIGTMGTSLASGALHGIYTPTFFSCSHQGDGVGGALVEGYYMLHELGHAFDQHYLTETGYPYGTSPEYPPEDYEAAGLSNLTNVGTGYLSSEPSVYTILNDAITNSPHPNASYRSGTELFAEACCVYWMSRNSLAASQTTSWTQRRDDAFGNSTRYDAFVAAMQALGAFP